LPATKSPYAPEPAGDGSARRRPSLIPGAGAVGAAIACLWLGVLIGGTVSLILAVVSTSIMLWGFAAFQRLRAKSERHARDEADLRRDVHGFTTLLDNLPGLVFQRVERRSDTPVFSYFSGRVVDYFGVTPEQAIDDSTVVSARVDPASIDEWREVLSAQREPGVPVSYEFEVAYPSGMAHWFMSVTRVRLLEDGSRVWDGIATDISEMKGWERALVSAKEEAIRANSSKSQFLAVMSHELRTPLNAVIGFSEVLQSELFGPLTDKQREYVVDILQSGAHLLDIVNEILDLAKIEAGKYELHEDSCAVAELIADQLDLIRPRAELDGLTVEFAAEPDLPLLYADPTKVRQMLLNLMTNAIKFTPTGGRITVALKLEPGLEGGPILALSVADTGVGIAAEDIPKAFASFEQIDNKLGRAHQGTGLGLPLVKVQIELHGGTVVLESALDVGTTVILRFPAWRLFRSIDELPRVAAFARRADVAGNKAGTPALIERAKHEPGDDLGRHFRAADIR
jgi:signal transduction histidine kinase